VNAGGREIHIEPLFDDQENDTRATTGAIYWEGAVRALHAGKRIGRGYLELTGYWRQLQL
jgi:predicted secreted hydrolase